MGLLLAVVVHPANIQDRDGAKLVIDKLIGRFPRMRLVWADAGYAGKLIEWVWALTGWALEIVKRPRDRHHFQVLPRRWVVERTFAWLSRCRRLLQEPAPYLIRGLRSSVRYNRGLDPHSYDSSHAPTLSTNLTSHTPSKEIAGAGAGLWVVGDTRQAIYRFRGAAPTNMQRFAEDFPGAKVKSLKYNYRSQPAIVDVFAGLAPNMRASRGGPSFSRWEPKRSDSGGRVLMEVAADLTAEAEGIAKEIERQRDSSISYSQQAILCRSHTNLGRVGTELEALGVPVLYLGNLFERPEVRDMLSLLSLTCEPDGRGLVRVARFPEYEVPLDLTPTRRRDCA